MCTSGNLYECQEEWENHWAEQKLVKKMAKKEWLWMDDLTEKGMIKNVSEGTWDYYSGLPNPRWYEEDNSNKSVNLKSKL